MNYLWTFLYLRKISFNSFWPSDTFMHGKIWVITSLVNGLSLVTSHKMILFCMDVSVHLQQGKFQLWVNWFMSQSSLSNVGLRIANTPSATHCCAYPDSKVHGANMGPIWGQQNPGGPYVGPMNFVIWVTALTLGHDSPVKMDWHQLNGITHWPQQWDDSEQEQFSTGLLIPGTGI